ncbi:MAG: DAK2 domain-containing protein, partial [Steroidobacteraceae bacterium]|nr:DAK2 domain-containing protein [Steroidobacteraceae bacterium]MDW8259655.1 DAK2 domain-containing protein [Gammaproteobacteria bacterium]
MGRATFYTELTAPLLRDGLQAAIHELFRQVEYLDRINVFPVPDGDTGTNLALTLASVLAVLERDATDHAGHLLQQVADAALDGARGNSGAILAQFLLGVADHGATLERLSIGDLAAALSAGAGNARLALTAPRDGTLLTLLETFARAFRDRSVAEPLDFAAVLRAVRPQLAAALARTTEQLSELRVARVVDAGAAGFVALIDGFARYLETGKIEVAAAPRRPQHDEPIPRTALGEHRYCTECLITGRDIDPRKVRESLHALGSSVVVGGRANKLRIHVHCNDPEQVFAVAARFGDVGGRKIDDMQRQRSAAQHGRQRRVAIVTDSAADLP